MSTPTIASSTLLNRRDLQFVLHEWLRVTDLCDRPRFCEHSRDTFDDVLTLAEQIATDHFAPHNRLADQTDPYVGEDGRVVLVDDVRVAISAFADSGLIGSAMDADVGGFQVPQVIATAALAWFQAANAATTAYPFLTMAAANAIIANGTQEQIDTWVRPMIDGRFFGTMCLSETQAGSSLADIATRAEPQEDGTYRIFGTKMWISGGDHELADNIVHLVLAKIPGGPPGVKGISLFIVPRAILGKDGEIAKRNDVVLAGLNHKMGYRGTVNTVLGFGEGTNLPGGVPGAVGYLVGEVHHGLAYMFHMMNEARIGVGLGATCLGYTGYLKALQYARERPQGRPVTTKGGASPQVPIIEHTDVRRMLLAQKAYAEGALALVLYCGRLVDEQKTAPAAADREQAQLLLDILTPIAKSWPSQWCLAANDLAIQVHGGYGYAREHDVEQHYRDNRLNPIHEGTHGIQGLDLLGRKVTMNGGAGFRLLCERIKRTIDRARDGNVPPAHAHELEAVLTRLEAVTKTVTAEPNPTVRLANASAYLEAAGHVVVAWIWLEQSLAAAGHEGPFYDGKRQATTYFFRYELPYAVAKLDLIQSMDRTTVDMQPGWF
jgi:alkylation response protein AidB-like acyl-CoA dehydrogenase